MRNFKKREGQRRKIFENPTWDPRAKPPAAGGHEDLRVKPPAAGGLGAELPAAGGYKGPAGGRSTGRSPQPLKKICNVEVKI